MEKKIKLAILSYYSGILDRGVETFVYELSKNLAKKMQITIIQAGESKNRADFINIKVIKSFTNNPRFSNGILEKFYFNWQSLKIFFFTLRALPFLIKGQYDFIIPTNGGWQTSLCRLLTKASKAKMIIVGHAGIGSHEAWNLLFRPDVFVSLTGAQSSWAKKLAPEVKIARIPHGIDVSMFNPKIKKRELGLPGKIVICAAALDSNKRVDLTIKAVAETDNLSLLVMGDGSERGKIDSLGKRLLSKRYRRIVVPYNQTPEYYSAGDVFTLPSKSEAFGVAYLEALASGLPVVATNDLSRQEIIGTAGILTSPENIDQYSKDLSIAAKNDYKKRSISQARKFSWDIVSKKYFSLFEELMK